MQHITDTLGNPLGVFFPIREWKKIQYTFTTLNDDWFCRAVREGLDSLHAKEYVSDEEMKNLFAQAGANVS